MSTVLRYTILSGDSYSSIAAGLDAAAGVTTAQIEGANPGTASTALQVGQVIDIPTAAGGGTALRYTVQPGDSYSAIATALGECGGIDTGRIEQANPGTAPTALQVGQVIAIPAATGEVIPDSTAPAPEAPLVPAAHIGYWAWTWGAGAVPPTGANMGIAFSGWSDLDNAMQQSARVEGSLVGEKYFSFGGGKADTGGFTSDRLQALTAAIKNGSLAGYQGIAYDIEVATGGLAPHFAASFAAAKAQGFKVLVTISHSAPFDAPDSAQLMAGFFADDNIDFLSPQLYTSGTETENEYATTSGVSVTWEQYATAKAAVIPSIVRASLYPSAEEFFKGKGVTTQGYIQWSQGG